VATRGAECTTIVAMKILIVDDEPAISDTLAYALQTDGFATECCTLGRMLLHVWMPAVTTWSCSTSACRT
jgi:CheY-like chemotaxis protein